MHGALPLDNRRKKRGRKTLEIKVKRWKRMHVEAKIVRIRVSFPSGYTNTSRYRGAETRIGEADPTGREKRDCRCLN